MEKQKGFTLIELLVVIAIVAVLSVVVILTLNPAELLKQARDSNRMSDLTGIKTAIALFLVDSGSTSIGQSASVCYVSLSASPGTRCSADANYWFSAGYGSVSATTTRSIDSTGWLPVNLAAITSGAPFGQLPIDPVNNGSYYYAYAAASSSPSFKLVTNMESTKYSNGGPGDAENTDGGTQPYAHEVGTLLTL